MRSLGYEFSLEAGWSFGWARLRAARKPPSTPCGQVEVMQSPLLAIQYPSDTSRAESKQE